MLIGEHSEMKKAKKILSLADLRERIRQRYYDRQDRILEKNSWKDYEKRLKQEACEEGRKEGIEKGISIGEHTKAIETARNALKLGLPIEQIQILTGLSLSEIQNLK